MTITIRSSIMRMTYCLNAFFVLCCTFSALSAGADAADVTMPFRYRNTQAGATIAGNATFVGVGYLTTGAYCAANHRDPDGNKYNHGHLPHGFDFANGGDTVTAQKSDWAWDAHYASYTRVSGSTFQKNCFAHCTGAPEVMFHDGWTAFTNASTQCEVTTKRKSFGDAGHVREITGIQTYSETLCVISTTSEKNASSGVYTAAYALPGGYATGDPVRKNKL
jgi:hypothetical protein